MFECAKARRIRIAKVAAKHANRESNVWACALCEVVERADLRAEVVDYYVVGDGGFVAVPPRGGHGRLTGSNIEAIPLLKIGSDGLRSMK